MALKVNLDALVERSDFAETDDEVDVSGNISTISAVELSKKGYLGTNLRKPDFQRETNNWSPSQIVTFIKSFLEGDLIPSIILWNSKSHVFVIDGGHRISALRAWIEDDYGDGIISRRFYDQVIPAEQSKMAEKCRRAVKLAVGTYADLEKILENPENEDEEKLKHARNLGRRAIQVQWVVGNAGVAETSFFKINTQGTPLDRIEEKVLRHRRKPAAIAARSIVRAGSGHKYWSGFDEIQVSKIEKQAKIVFELLFEPDLKTPIKTLDLPLGGTVSPVTSLGLLMDLIGATSSNGIALEDQSPDIDGNSTYNALADCRKVLSRITGNDKGSLGLHPAIYFYNEKGKHSIHLFLGIVELVSRKIRNNDKSFFKKITKGREKIEIFLIENKPLIQQLISKVYSTKRVSTVSGIFDYIVSTTSKEEQIDMASIFKIAGLKDAVIASIGGNSSTQFSEDAKSETFLSSALTSSVRCPICHGAIDTQKSTSYDHIIPKREEGGGARSNCQITHPYCNQSIKQ